MSTFDNCLIFVLQQEGGNSDAPHDPGGRTSRGVTQRTYDAWRHKNNLPTQDVYAMSDPECATIYYNDMKTPKSYRQECVIAALVKGMQEQQMEIASLEKRVH